MRESDRERVLVFNCHEAWVHQLGLLDYDLDIICDLPCRSGRKPSGNQAVSHRTTLAKGR